MTNFLGWELFPRGGSTVGTLGPCILLNVPKVGHTNVHTYMALFEHVLCEYVQCQSDQNGRGKKSLEFIIVC